MNIQTEKKVAESANGRSVKFEFYHPITAKRCYAWFPVSQIKELKFNKIKIPSWLWRAKSKEL